VNWHKVLPGNPPPPPAFIYCRSGHSSYTRGCQWRAHLSDRWSTIRPKSAC
jgi:hypothetical protein